jgi:hypothetical protein
MRASGSSAAQPANLAASQSNISYLYAHERGSDASGKRPLAGAHRINDWLFTWLPDTDDAHDIVAALKAAGYTSHRCSGHIAQWHAQRFHLRHTCGCRLF